jgi:hypothetical protein
MFACLCDTVIAPRPPLPAVGATDAVEAFDRYLVASPPLHRLGLRGLLLAAELAPLLLGFHARLRGLSGPQRGSALHRAERSRARPLVELAESLARLAYFGDDGVMRRLGYDPEANLRRARAAR